MSRDLKSELFTRTRPAELFEDLGDGRLRCLACAHRCPISEGHDGVCKVRGVRDGVLRAPTGYVAGLQVDPIEKKPLNHFFPGTSVLSLGTAGCNLGCKFCQNHDISKSRRMDALQSVATPEAVVEAAVAHDCKSIAFTYNDPTIWAEYAIDIARAARAAGVKTVAVTAGYISPEPRRAFYDCMDAANVDLKGFSETFYRKLTQTSLRPVLDTIAYIANETRCWLELTTLVIPGENDSDDELRAMCRWVVDHVGRDVPMHFTAFHPDYRIDRILFREIVADPDHCQPIGALFGHHGVEFERRAFGRKGLIVVARAAETPDVACSSRISRPRLKSRGSVQFRSTKSVEPRNLRSLGAISRNSPIRFLSFMSITG